MLDNMRGHRSLEVKMFTSDNEHNEGEPTVYLEVYDGAGNLIANINVSRASLLAELGVSS